MSDRPSKQRVQERIRENKRRHRARKKEYVEELERKLRGYQQQGVQAAQEIQVAALRVVEQNIRLKELLRRVGVDDCTIQAWLQGEEKLRSLPRKCSPVAKTETEPAYKPSGVEDCQNNIRGGLRSYTAEPPRCSSEQPTKHPTGHPPCKIMTILAENPNIDITQISAQSEDQVSEEPSNGVECFRAYEMCMRLATSDEAVGGIAQSLEKGCVKNATSEGCRVKNEVVWEIIDKLSL
ncbi:hypothetical protein TWF281_000090 [Arthrobotrys megalospora]